MPVEAIGSTLDSTTSDVSRTSLSQDDFIKLFMTELTFQDPLEPINNREFLAQMAQFANLEQTRITNENTSNIVAMNSTSQSLGLLGKHVQITDRSGNIIDGAVSAIIFSTSGPVMTLTKNDGSQLTDVRLSQIQLVRP